MQLITDTNRQKPFRKGVEPSQQMQWRVDEARAQGKLPTAVSLRAAQPEGGGAKRRWNPAPVAIRLDHFSTAAIPDALSPLPLPRRESAAVGLCTVQSSRMGSADGGISDGRSRRAGSGKLGCGRACVGWVWRRRGEGWEKGEQEAKQEGGGGEKGGREESWESARQGLEGWRDWGNKVGRRGEGGCSDVWAQGGMRRRMVAGLKVVGQAGRAQGNISRFRMQGAMRRQVLAVLKGGKRCILFPSRHDGAAVIHKCMVKGDGRGQTAVALSPILAGNCTQVFRAPTPPFIPPSRLPPLLSPPRHLPQGALDAALLTPILAAGAAALCMQP
ncbi:unnamed protein product [Closterium sp. Naga37s-1]|nr:unnamed protein product [Closterium sp. Naga37s-1]